MAHPKHTFMEKIMEKLPGHHHIPDVSGEETEETCPRNAYRESDETDSTETPGTAIDLPQVQKKSMMQKMRQRFSGHGNEKSGANNAYDTPVPKDSSEPGAKNVSVDDSNRGGYDKNAAEDGVARRKSF